MRARRHRRRWLRWTGRALFAGLVVVSGAVLLFWPWVVAQGRGGVVISSVLGVPALTSAVGGVSGEPRFEDARVAGNPALIARPVGEGPWPAVFFVNGTVRQGRDLAAVRKLAGGFARAGYLVVVPDLPGLREERPSGETVRETVEVARAVADRPGAEGRKVALVGISTGGALALRAAREDELDGRLSVVAAVAPYADIRTVLSVATTGHYKREGTMVPYEADPFLSYVAARALVGALPEGGDKEVLTQEVRGITRDDPDPLSGWRTRGVENLGPDARAVVGLLGNRDPQHFDRLYRELPVGIRRELESLSPVDGEGEIEAPVEIATGTRDKFFPVDEAYRARTFAPEVNVTVTPALGHAGVGFSPGELASFMAFDAFVVRSLRAADAGGR